MIESERINRDVEKSVTHTYEVSLPLSAVIRDCMMRQRHNCHEVKD